MAKLLLPKSAHELSSKVSNQVEKMRPFLSGMNENQFFSALVSEVNQLDANINFRSVLRSAVNLCILGLIPGGAMGHAYLVPFKGQCQVITGYKGLLELAIRSGYLSVCHPPELVLEGEKFRQWNDENGNHFEHQIPIKRDISKPNIVGAYVSYRTVTGGDSFQFVPRSEIDEIDSGRNVWRTNYPAMCRKTPIRRAANTWRQTKELARAILLDDLHERGEEQACPELEESTAPDTKANLKRNLEATLSQRVGCETAEHRLIVLRTAVGDPDISLTDVFGDEEKMRAAMMWFVEHSILVGWTNILKECLHGNPEPKQTDRTSIESESDG